MQISKDSQTTLAKGLSSVPLILSFAFVASQIVYLVIGIFIVPSPARGDTYSQVGEILTYAGYGLVFIGFVLSSRLSDRSIRAVDISNKEEMRQLITKRFIPFLLVLAIIEGGATLGLVSIIIAGKTELAFGVISLAIIASIIHAQRAMHQFQSLGKQLEAQYKQ